MASFDLTSTIVAKWTDKNGQSIVDTVTVSTITRPIRAANSTDNSGWDLLYDASQTTVIPIGNADPGDAPFYFGIFVDAASGIVLKITDDQADVMYLNIPANSNLELKSDLIGSTAAAIIEQIEVQSLTATPATFEYLLAHD